MIDNNSIFNLLVDFLFYIFKLNNSNNTLCYNKLINMNISLKFMVIFFVIVLTISITCNNILISTFAKSSGDNNGGFVEGNVIQICCAWGPELKSGVLTYSIDGGDKKTVNAVNDAIDAWNQNLGKIQFVKVDSGDENIKISFKGEGKIIAGRTVNSVDKGGFIRQSHIIISKESFDRKFSLPQIEQITKHELGHVLGLRHANFNGNLMTNQVNTASAIISPCVIEAVNTANAWKIIEDGDSMHGPTKKFVAC